MMMSLELPFPSLSEDNFDSLLVVTDKSLFSATNVRIAFTRRDGGVSDGSYATLNLSDQVGDSESAVAENRRRLFSACGVSERSCIIPRQVHGSNVLVVSGSVKQDVGGLQEKALNGFDAVLISVPEVAALLCFADCVPLIVVSPTGSFVVVHAGWRGVEAKIAIRAIEALKIQDGEAGFLTDGSSFNAYIGPHIGKECFETGREVSERFAKAFGASCLAGNNRVDLSEALITSLKNAGVQKERIASVSSCTMCSNEEYFSYRAQDGICGRHGAFAVRKEYT